MNKPKDSLFLPDFEGIEIKCTTKYSNYPLYLFTIAFDGPTFPEIDRLIELYGSPDKDITDKKVLFAKLSVSKKHIVNDKFKFLLKLDEFEEKMFLEVFDLNNNLIEMKSFVYLKSIYDHLMMKLRKLAIIKANKKVKAGNEYFKYYSISIYELISFERFIELLYDDYILVDLIARINKSGHDKGRYRNKNLVFSIRKEFVEKLFKKVYEYNIEKNNRYNYSDFLIMDEKFFEAKGL